MNWSKWLEIREGNEGLPDLNKKLRKLNKQAGSQSGMPGYEDANSARKEVLRKIEKERPLTRSEYINLYGYEAWQKRSKGE